MKRIVNFRSSRDKGSEDMQVYMKKIEFFPLLTPEEENELGRLNRAGDLAARKKLIEHNLRWVVKIANMYVGRGLPIDDLVQLGNIGLMRAAQDFDERKAKFSTYSAQWIQQSIRRALSQQGSTIRIPAGTLTQAFRVMKEQMRLREQLSREPTAEEISDALGNIKPPRVAELIGILRMRIRCGGKGGDVGEEAPLSKSSVEAIVDRHLASDEVVVVSEHSRAVPQLIAEFMKFVAETVSISQRADTVMKVFYCVYGVDADGARTVPLTNARTGLLLGISRERVRQILKRWWAIIKRRVEISGKIDQYGSDPEVWLMEMLKITEEIHDGDFSLPLEQGGEASWPQGDAPGYPPVMRRKKEAKAVTQKEDELKLCDDA